MTEKYPYKKGCDCGACEHYLKRNNPPEVSVTEQQTEESEQTLTEQDGSQ